MTDEGEQQNASNSTDPNEKVESEPGRVDFFLVHEVVTAKGCHESDVISSQWVAMEVA